MTNVSPSAGCTPGRPPRRAAQIAGGPHGEAALEGSVLQSLPLDVAGGLGNGLWASGVPGRARIGEIQRARILTATTELVRERGVGGITVAHIVGRSGVSRRTFYELFADREDCLLAALEYALQRAAALVVPAYECAGDTWEERIRAGLEALLRFLDREPALGGLCIVDALAADRAVLERRARVLDALIDAVHQGGGRGPGAPGARAVANIPGSGARKDARSRTGGPRTGTGSRRPGRIVAEGAVGAVFAIVHARMRERDTRPLAGLLNQLMGMIVLPYLGPEAAARELKRPVPRRRRSAATVADPLQSLDMRLTYRTVRVLLAISELDTRGSAGQQSSPSSREVGDAAGVADQGQISKLLWRLESLGLIANAVQRQGRGEANAWSLTPRGRELERAIRAQTGS